MKLNRIIASGLTAAMLFGITACAQTPPAATPAPATTQTTTAAPATSAPAATTTAATTTAKTTTVAATTAAATTAASATTAAPVASASGTLTDLPRNQTLYFGGQQWGTINNWNPYSANANNAMTIASASSARVTMFETLYMYNLLDGTMHPLLALGDPVWNSAQTEMTIKMNPAAHWSDGTPVTADDVAYTWATQVKHQLPNSLQFGDYIDSITATDPQTVDIKLKTNDDGTPVNAMMIEQYIISAYVVQKAWTQTLEARTTTQDQFMNDVANDVVSSGPYRPFYNDDQKVVLQRDDNYWGQDKSLWGSLPVPKYLAHAIYADNASTQVALEANQIDVDQQFIADVQNLWLQKNEPISTYMDQPPYGICTTMPSAWFNMKSYGLDQVAVRKAIAMAVDYDQINQNAMTGQSPTFAQVPRSLMNPTAGEQAMYDQSAVADLQWTGKDIDGAKKLLDDAGITDTNNDGLREYNGQTLHYNAVCPNGWTDWMASMEIVAQAGKDIGIDITTLYPEWDTYQTVFTDGTQTQYDIFMWAGDASGPTYPWLRVRQRLSSEYVGTKNNWNGNFGGYSNPDADAIVQAIPKTTDPAKLKDLYTQAVKIYLTDVPSFALMYRPELFYAVNESTWTNYPSADDGRNIPPTDCTDGYGIAGLYGLKLVQ